MHTVKLPELTSRLQSRYPADTSVALVFEASYPTEQVEHASNNLAKLPFLFETTVPRARLRPKYGQGFGRKSGRVTAKRATPGR